MSKPNRYWDRVKNRWIFTDKGGNKVAEFGGEIGFYGATPVTRQAHLADPTTASYGAIAAPVTASYGAIPSYLANVADTDVNKAVGSLTWMINQVGAQNTGLNNVVGSLNWMINQVRAGVASINTALESIGILNTS